jgi:hypothetical protein
MDGCRTVVTTEDIDMVSRFSVAILAGCLLAVQAPLVAQYPAGDVTLKVPLNFTKLSTELARIKVSCRLQSLALIAVDLQGQETHGVATSIDVPVSNGQAVTTVTVVFSNFSLTNPAGVTANYQCSVMGFDRTGSGSSFSETSADPKYRLTPAPAPLTGTFTW